MKKTFAREIIILFSAILAVLVFSGLTKAFQAFRLKSLTEDSKELTMVLDNLKKVDLKRKVLFYFCEVEKETFLDLLYRDYKATVLKKTPDFSSFIDTLKEYNGILYSSFDFIMMDKSRKQYYLDNLKYPEFEKEAKNSIIIYDKKLPSAIIEDIKEKVLSKKIGTTHIENFWRKATKNPESVFSKMSETYKKYYSFSNSQDLIAYLKLYSGTSYQDKIIEIQNQISNKSKSITFWDKLNFITILAYIGIIGFVFCYLIRGLWYLILWAIINK